MLRDPVKIARVPPGVAAGTAEEEEEAATAKAGGAKDTDLVQRYT